MTVSALDLYLIGRRYTEAIQTIGAAPVAERWHLSTRILASSALEAYFKASLAIAGQPPDYPSRFYPFYRQDLVKLYRDAQAAGLASIKGVDQLIEEANFFHQLFRRTDAGDILALSYIEALELPPPSLDVLKRLDQAVAAHLQVETE